MRTQFDRELADIRNAIQQLGAQASRATARAVDALINRNMEEARAIKRDDISSDKLRYEIESLCLTVIATQQPVARDLRELTAATFVAVELERCGDYAKGIAKAARRIIRANCQIDAFGLREMADHAHAMLDRSIEAFVRQDAALARELIDMDQIVDQHYDTLLQQVTAEMSSHPQNIEGGIWVLHAGHCLERIGDRATNIAERVIFLDTGVLTGDLNTRSTDGARTLFPG
ncbi:MAG: phosphate signaling complex protein PhoU [Anaerolineae bacterium]|nr:phosphate signaling complex protein PhoU [Thermoflexales bacterium]MDW8407804.1 phosphate signaling complex protein PhoU [Anaerolineae bacterium]